MFTVKRYITVAHGRGKALKSEPEVIMSYPNYPNKYLKCPYVFRVGL